MCPHPRRPLITQFVTRATLLLSIALMVLSLCSCAGLFAQNKSSIQPWIENGVTQGTITRTITSFGYDHHYKDTSRRLVRVERYNMAGALLPGACRIEYEYDDRGRLVKESIYNADRELAVGDFDYALKKTVYVGASEKPDRDLYFGADGEACEIQCHGVEGTAEVKYVYLQGVGEVACAIFYGMDGRVLARKHVSGKIFEVTKD